MIQRAVSLILPALYRQEGKKENIVSLYLAIIDNKLHNNH